MLKRGGAVTCLTALLAAALGAAAAAEWGPAGSDTRRAVESSPPVIPASAEVVELEVLVSDRSGNPVSGLRAEDFEVHDNGQLRALSHFADRRTGLEKAEREPARSRPLEPVLSAGETRRVIAFVVDTLHLEVDSLMRTRRMLEDFIAREMEPRDVALIMATTGGSGLLQQFTVDQRMLRRAAARLVPFSEASGEYAAPFDTIDSVVQAMARLPGRRLVIFVCEGWPDRVPRMRLRDTAGRAAAANVVLYAVNPLGLEGPMDSAAASSITPASENGFDQRGRSAPTGGRRGADRFWKDSSLVALAEPSGGKALVDWSDISAAVRRTLQENAEYYVLGFQLEGKDWDGRYHRVKVSLRGRTDLVVSTRQGYLARSAGAVARTDGDMKTDEIAEAVSSPLVRRDIDVVLTPLYSDDGDRQPQLTTVLHIDPARLVFKEIEGQHRLRLERVGYLLDASGKALDPFRTVTTLDLAEDGYRETLRRGLVSMRRTSVKPGLYQARILVRDLESGLIGTANCFVEMPNLKGGRLVLSSIFADVRYLQAPGSAAAGDGATLSQRRFPRGSEFGYRFLIYNAKTAGRGTGLTIKTRILRQAELIQESPQAPVEPISGSTPQRIAAGGTVRLGGLEPDEYTLEVIVTDSRGQARQEIRFLVE